MTGYWRASRAPRYSLLFALPLLVLYELLAFTLSHEAVQGVRNGADVLLKSLFVGFGGRDGLILFGVLLIGGGAVLVWRDLRRGGSLEPRVFGLMLAESVVYALTLGVVVGTLTGLLLGGLTLSIQAGAGAPAWRCSTRGRSAAPESRGGASPRRPWSGPRRSPTTSGTAQRSSASA